MTFPHARTAAAATLAVLAVGLLAGCETVVVSRPGSLSRPLGGEQTGYVDPSDDRADAGTMSTTSGDIVNMTEKMITSMLASPALADAADPPRIICDAKYFQNRSGDPNIDTGLLAGRIRSNLNKYAAGRMIFVAEHGGATQILDEESRVRGEAPRFRVDAKYRLMGQIHSHPNPGRSNYMFFNFEVIDTSTAEMAWSDNYEFKKVGTDPIGYDR